jgi:hypothetical protein
MAPSLKQQIKTAEKNLEAARKKLKELFPGKSDRDIKNLMAYKDEQSNTKKASAYQTVKGLESKISFLKQKAGTRRSKGRLNKTRRSI